MMILDESEKTHYNVANGIHCLTIQDEKSASQYNTRDQPPSYEALFAAAPTPSSFNPIATQSTTIQSSNTSFLPCVVPRKQSLATTLKTSPVKTLQKYPNPSAAPTPAPSPAPTHHPSKTTTSPNQTSSPSSTASIKSSSRIRSYKASAPQARSCRCSTARP